MSKDILKFSTLSKTAWQYFLQDKKSWVLEAFFYIILLAAKIIVSVSEPEYMNSIILMLNILIALLTSMLYQKSLDVVSGKKLSMVHITLPVIYASLFFFLVSSYSITPVYTKFLLLIVPDTLSFLPLLSLFIHIVVSYFLLRFMFVGMLILENKSTIQNLFYTSFAMTKGHIFSLCKIIMYLSIIFALSCFTVIGVLVTLPYFILVQTVVFKRLYEKINA